MSVDLILSFPVLEELTEGKQWGSFQEQFGDDAAGTKTIHGLSNPSVTLPFRLVDPGLFRADFGVTFLRVEPFRCQITCATPRHIEVEGKIRWVIEGKIGGLVRCKVGEVDPVP